MVQNDQMDMSDRALADVRLLSRIARANGSHLSVQDLLTLTDINSAKQTENAELIDSDFSRLYELTDGFVFERGFGDNARASVLNIERGKIARAHQYSNFARKFASFLDGTTSTVVAISGSTSYQSASDKDDLDFFCVTRPRSLWIFLTRGLLLARFFRLFASQTPRICFSYAVDQGYAKQDFASSNEALFARDALTARVIRGKEAYARLLKNSSWIANYFPRLYQQRTSVELDQKDGERHKLTPSPARTFLNLFLFRLVGGYIAARSFLLNCAYRKRGNSLAVFKAKIGTDHCIFESARYNRLRVMYAPFSSKTSREEAEYVPLGAV